MTVPGKVSVALEGGNKFSGKQIKNRGSVALSPLTRCAVFITLKHTRVYLRAQSCVCGHVYACTHADLGIDVSPGLSWNRVV